MSQNDVNIELKREGFSVRIGELDFFFGTSVEDLKIFFGIQEEIDEKLKMISPPMKNDDINETINYLNKQCEVQYDALLGDGSYNKIYNTFPYPDVLLAELEIIELAIADRIENIAKIRADNFSKKKAELMKNKLAKNKKKKK